MPGKNSCNVALRTVFFVPPVCYHMPIYISDCSCPVLDTPGHPAKRQARLRVGGGGRWGSARRGSETWKSVELFPGATTRKTWRGTTALPARDKLPSVPACVPLRVHT